MRNTKETEKIEFKKSTAKLKEWTISIVAILNKHGKGELFFGFNDVGFRQNRLLLSK